MSGMAVTGRQLILEKLLVPEEGNAASKAGKNGK